MSNGTNEVFYYCFANKGKVKDHWSRSKEYWDQYQYLGNCPPTPPLTQQQSIDNNLGLILG